MPKIEVYKDWSQWCHYISNEHFNKILLKACYCTSLTFPVAYAWSTKGLFGTSFPAYLTSILYRPQSSGT